MRRDIGQIIASYFCGIVIGSLAAVAYFKDSGVFIFVLGAASFVALPFLALAICVFLLFRNNIKRHLSIWCGATPLIVVLLWMTLEWATLAPHIEASKYFSARNTWVEIGIAFACASGSAFLFWLWNRNPKTSSLDTFARNTRHH
jgi:uncharacterized membrane protein YozB (DUF420 family)